MIRLSLLSYFTLLGLTSSLVQAQTSSIPTYAPLPPSASQPAIPPEGYLTTPLGKGAYMVSEGAYQALFFVTPKSVILVDAPPTIGHSLQYAIGNITTNPVTHLIYSHHHADHISAATLFATANRHLKVIAHEECLKALKDARPDPAKRPLPQITFTEHYTLKVENQTLELRFLGENHSPDNIIIWAPVQRILMLVDVIFPGYVPFSGLAVSSYIPGWINAHDEILKYPFEHYLGGHLSSVGKRSDVKIQLEYLNDLYNDCKATIIDSGNPNNTEVGIANTFPPVMMANPGNFMVPFKTYFDTVAGACGKTTADKWIGRLGAADVWQKENALAMLIAFRIDYGVLGPFGLMP